MTVRIDIASAFICPWCWIADNRLARVIESLPKSVDVDIEWRPFELNPNMPPEGLDRKAYRSAKFGSWERSQQLDAGTVDAGAADGVLFNYDRMLVTPNTFAAHRLSWLAARYGVQTKIVEAIMRAYFVEGRDIGDAEATADIAKESGLDRSAVLTFLGGDEGSNEIRNQEDALLAEGIRGVPFISIEGKPLDGARSAEEFRRTILDAHARNLAEMEWARRLRLGT